MRNRMAGAVPKRGRSDAIGYQRGERLETGLVLGIEARGEGAVEVDHRDHRARANHRDDELGSARRVAGDVAGEGVDIRDALSRARGGGGAAHAAPERDADARGLAAERAEHEL